MGASQSPEYKKLHTKYQGELRDILKKRYDRFAVLHRWNFTDPARNANFSVENSPESKAQRFQRLSRNPSRTTFLCPRISKTSYLRLPATIRLLASF